MSTRTNRAAPKTRSAGELIQCDVQRCADLFGCALALREVAKRGPKLGPNRRHSHAAAVEVALAHLAQVSGHPDASRLEWACEARLAQETQLAWRTGAYRAEVVIVDADPVITMTNARQDAQSGACGRARRHATSSQCQDQLRDQARRLRTGLLESLVANGKALSPEELAQLRALPASAAMLPALLRRDHTWTVGWLDDIDTSEPIIAAREDHGAWQPFCEGIDDCPDRPADHGFASSFVLGHETIRIPDRLRGEHERLTVHAHGHIRPLRMLLRPAHDQQH